LTLPPLANLFAVADGDPGALDRLEERLVADGGFERVWRPAPGWVAAHAPLPDSDPEPDALSAAGFAFTEGRDRLGGGDDTGWLERLAELCDRSPERLGELPGDFGFVRFRADGTALAVRSAGGRVPLYLHARTPGGVAIGTLLDYFPRLLPGRFRADPLVNASWARALTGKFIGGRTFVADISVLARGSHTEVGPDRPPRTSVHWDPRHDESPEPSPEHARELRRIMLEYLERELDPEGRNLLFFSGGVDSSALAALIGGTLGKSMSSWSMLPASDPGLSAELSYIEPLVERYGIKPTHMRRLTDEARRGWIAHAPGLPFQVLHPALCDLPNVCAEQEVRTVVSGMFADEVCGERKRLHDWALHTSLRDLATGVPLPFGRRDYLRWARRRIERAAGRARIDIMELDEWAPPEVQDEYRGWVAAELRAIAWDPQPLPELAARADADAWVAAYWEASSPLGARPLLPFFTREVLELAFRCHPRDLLGPGKKRLLRDALGDDVPARNLFREDRGTWTGHAREARWPLDGPLPAAAEGLVRPDWIAQPPVDVEFMAGSRLSAALRVAEHLERSEKCATNGLRDPETR
jgi:asparagine synthetase B (glutamine-hydrolysing)